MLDLLFYYFVIHYYINIRDDTETRCRNPIYKERQTKPNIGLLFFSIYMGNFKKRKLKH